MNGHKIVDGNCYSFMAISNPFYHEIRIEKNNKLIGIFNGHSIFHAIQKTDSIPISFKKYIIETIQKYS